MSAKIMNNSESQYLFARKHLQYEIIDPLLEIYLYYTNNSSNVWGILGKLKT
jgi:hypothetical protein